MNNTKYQIFEPSLAEKSTSNNVVMFLIWTFALSFFWLTDKYSSPNDFLRYFKNIYLICAVMLSIYWLIGGLWTYKSLEGSFNGTLVFEEDAFQVNMELIKLEDISAINIFGGDYYGQRTRGVVINFDPSLSQGVNNYIEFTDLEKLVRRIYFKQTENDQFRELKTFIINCTKLNRLSVIRATELLGITNYEDIQEFKQNYH